MKQFLTLLVVCYIVGAFIIGDFNPTNWDEQQRWTTIATAFILWLMPD